MRFGDSISWRCHSLYCIYHANYSTMVVRRDNELWSQCVYLNTDTEAVGMLRAEVSSFQIKKHAGMSTGRRGRL